MDSSPIPSFKDRDVLVKLESTPGTSNPRMREIATTVTRELRSIPGVDNVGAHVGRAVTGDQIVDVNSSEVWVNVGSEANYDETLENINDAVRRVAGVGQDVAAFSTENIDVETYSSRRIRDVGALNEGDNPVRGDGLDVLTGTHAPLVARVYGQDPAVLRREAEKVRQVMSDVDGVVDPRVRLPAEQPALEVEV